MAQAEANGILIEYEAFGRRADPAVVLVAGNGAQMLFWETEFCELLASRGLFVVRFDNRDSGLSTTFDELGVPDMAEAYAAQREGRPFRPPYTLRDMSDDIAGLLDALGIGRAIVCGASMGGAVAQTFAFAHPERTLGLVSMMSSTGNPDNPQIDPQTLAIVTEEPPSERAAYLEHTYEMWRRLWSPGFPFEERRARAYVERCFDRSLCPNGAVRQNAALVADGDRRGRLGNVTAPTLVVHGTADPLFPVEAGIDTARSIPGAELLLIEGMAHDMPVGAWGRIVDAIARLSERSRQEG